MRFMETNEKKTFNFMDFAAGTNFPTDTVDVYTDADAAYQIGKLEAKANSTGDDKVVKELEESIAELRRQFKASKVTIYMRGISPRMEEKLNKEADKKFGSDEKANLNDKIQWYNNAFIAAHITKVENAEGAVDDRDWTSEDITALFLTITPESIKRIVSMTQTLTLKADIFANVEVNPDF